MALPLFVPAISPTSRGTSHEISIRQRSAKFGDGYEQRAEDGINSRAVAGRWQWDALSSAAADAIVTFLSANALTGFRYTFPTESTERNYKASGITRSYLGAGLQSITVQVEQIFDPV